MKSLALLLTRQPAECEIHSHCFHKVVIHLLLDGGSLPPDYARRLCQTNYNANKDGFVKGGGEREVRRLPPILSVVIPIGNIKKANNMRLPKSREQPAGKIWPNLLCCHYLVYR